MAKSLIPRLLSLGFSVRGFESEAVDNPIEDVEYLTGDITKSSTMSEITHGVDHIFHLPGRHPEDKGPSGQNREGKDLTTTIKLANIAKSLEVISFVYLSSSEVYGIPRRILISEKEKRRPISRRGKDLLRIEDYLINTMATRGIGVVIVRTPPITGWGAPRESFPSLVHAAKRALTGRSLLLVGGGKYSVQYVDVEDLASALVRSIRKVKPGCLTLNVAAEDVISQRDLADFFIDFYHSSSGIIRLPAAAIPFVGFLRGLGTPPFATESHFLFYPQTIIDTFMAKELLLYSPKRTVESISEMLKSWDLEGTEGGPGPTGRGYGVLFRDLEK